MDFSFYSNILVTVTSLLLTRMLWTNGIKNHFLGFFVFTGLSSLLAAYGHSDMTGEILTNNILLISRLLSIWSLYYFARGTLSLFGLYTFKPAKAMNAVTPLILVLVLLVKNSFFPVMVYGVLSMAMLGSLAFSLKLRSLPRVSVPMVTGIVISIIAAMIFGFLNEFGNLKPADVSHILLAIALVFMAVGVKNTSLYEMEKA